MHELSMIIPKILNNKALDSDGVIGDRPIIALSESVDEATGSPSRHLEEHTSPPPVTPNAS